MSKESSSKGINIGGDILAIKTDVDNTTAVILGEVTASKDSATEVLNDTLALLESLVTLASSLQPITSTITIDEQTFSTDYVVEPLPDFDIPVYIPPPIPPDPEIWDLVSSEIQTKVYQDIIYGGTGLSDAVEQAIFDRELERSKQVRDDAIDQLTSEWAKRGLDFPDGVLAMNLFALEVEYQNKRMTTSREIAIKQADLEQANVHFSIQQLVAIEDMINKFNLGLFSGEIQGYQAQVAGESARISGITDTYKSMAEVYKASASIFESAANVDIKVYEAKIKEAEIEADILIKNAELNEKSFEAVTSLQMEAIKAAATISAQVAAGAMAGISVSAHVSASASEAMSASEGISDSYSLNESNAWSWTETTSLSDSSLVQDITTHEG